MSTVKQVAPYPTTADEVTATGLARHLTAAAHSRQPLLFDPERSWAFNEAFGSAYVAEYATAALLRALVAVDQQRADEVARDVWESWEDGGDVGEHLREWLTEYGIDPDALEPYRPRGETKTAVTPAGSQPSNGGRRHTCCGGCKTGHCSLHWPPSDRSPLDAPLTHGEITVIRLADADATSDRPAPSDEDQADEPPVLIAALCSPHNVLGCPLCYPF